MLHINIITLGKLKEDYFKDAEKEYLKRLMPFAKISVIEIKEEAFDEKSNTEMIKQKDAQNLMHLLEEKNISGYNIILDEHGMQFSSKELSEKIDSLMQDNSTFNFIIGGPLGLHEDILKLANLKLSFSKLTFTHQMMRIFLLEQIYRSFMILNNKKYHY